MTITKPNRRVLAILFDDQDRLVLIKRIRPGQPPHWVAPGGGVQGSDPSIEAALRRDLAEELGAQVGRLSQVLLFSPPDNRSEMHYFYAGRLARMSGPALDLSELSDPAHGSYGDMAYIPLDALEPINLKPTSLKEFILTNRQVLLASVRPA